MIEITVRKRAKPPLPDAHIRFDVFLGERKLCVSRQPLLTSARILLREGADPADRLGMRWEGSEHIALSGVIGDLAKWTVEENRNVGPRFRPVRVKEDRLQLVPMRYFAEVLSE